MSGLCIIPRPWGTAATAAASRTNPAGYFLGQALTRAAAAASSATAPGVPVGRLGKSLCGFDDPFNPLLADIEPFPPGDDGRVVITISNVNNVQDDTWDFAINGVVVCTYDGGGDTTISFSGDLPAGTWELTATNTADNGSGNYFTVTVTVDAVTVIETDTVDGSVGSTVTVGTFNT